MNTLFAITLIVLLVVIIGLLVDILGELRLAKKDREDERSQKANWIDTRHTFDKE